MAGATVEYSSLLTMKTRLSRLRSDFGPAYPEAIALEKQIEEMQTFLDNRAKSLLVSEQGIQITPDDVMNAYVNMLENDLRALEQQGQDVQSQMKQAEEQAKTLVSFILEDEQLLRKRTRLDDLYNSTIERLQALNMQKDAASIVQELIESPKEGEVVEPKISTAAALAVISTILLAILTIQLAEFRDSRIHTSQELEKILNTRVVGHIGNFDRSSEVRKLTRTLRKSKSTASQYLVTHHLPTSRISEGFRAIRTQILFAIGAKNKVIGVTSALPSSGKSTIASNFSVSLASAGHSTILIDCDLRLPQIHDIFGIANDQGLTEAIQGMLPLEKLLVQSATPNLTLLPSGIIPSNPAELLSSPEFRALLAELKLKYAYVVLDCPPVLPVSDPSIIAPLTDGLLFISVVKDDLKPQIERSKEILRGAGGRILGCIVNRADDAGPAYGYYAYGYENAATSDNYFPAK
ncbi:MAG: polysaccharide biosynthesis tyrosine autokinase [Pirellulaceae bacterium]